MPAFVNFDRAQMNGRIGMSVFRDDDARVDSNPQTVVQRPGHRESRLAETDDDQTTEAAVPVFLADGIRVFLHGAIGIGGGQRRPEYVFQDGFSGCHACPAILQQTRARSAPDARSSGSRPAVIFRTSE